MCRVVLAQAVLQGARFQAGFPTRRLLERRPLRSPPPFRLVLAFVKIRHIGGLPDVRWLGPVIMRHARPVRKFPATSVGWPKKGPS